MNLIYCVYKLQNFQWKNVKLNYACRNRRWIKVKCGKCYVVNFFSEMKIIYRYKTCAWSITWVFYWHFPFNWFLMKKSFSDNMMHHLFCEFTFNVRHAEATLKHVLFKVAWRSRILLPLLSASRVDLKHHFMFLAGAQFLPLLLLCCGTGELRVNTVRRC